MKKFLRIRRLPHSTNVFTLALQDNSLLNKDFSCIYKSKYSLFPFHFVNDINITGM